MTWLDPLQVRDPKDAYDDGYADGLAAQPDWRRVLLALLVVAAIAFAFGYWTADVHAAAPRSAQDVAPAPTGAPIGTSRTDPRLSNAPDASRLGAGDEDRGRAIGAPSPRPVELGTASWYDNGPGLYAATPAYRGDPYTIQACGFEDGRTNCLTLLVVDHCACYVGTHRERIIDLSPAAFRSLAPLSKGLVRVTVERLAP